ncbi:MAG: GntR family transcriptional regulator [Planctomycetes bacterium]|nr:GntR family transcriptional regulator [Planctomycetota bacterium]
MIERDKHKKRQGRPPRERTKLVKRIRGRILDGQYGPGDRLPTRREIKRTSGKSLVTVQRALSDLKKQGFLSARPGDGTYVVERPPHLYRYGFLLPASPDGPGNHFFKALRAEALHFEKQSKREMVFYEGVSGPVLSDAYEKLLSDVRSHRLAGLISLSYPAYLEGTPILKEPDLPRVAIGQGEPRSNASVVRIDQNEFLKRSLEYLQEKGREKIAVVLVLAFSRSMEPDAWRAQLEPLLQERGMTTKTSWIQAVDCYSEHWAANTSRLLGEMVDRSGPDGLVIADDNVVEPVTRGLVEAEVKIPEELEIVAHCNFPWPTPSAAPVKRIGFDLHRVLECCFELIDRQRQEGKAPGMLEVPPVLEENATKKGDLRQL